MLVTVFVLYEINGYIIARQFALFQEGRFDVFFICFGGYSSYKHLCCLKVSGGTLVFARNGTFHLHSFVVNGVAKISFDVKDFGCDICSLESNVAEASGFLLGIADHYTVRDFSIGAEVLLQRFVRGVPVQAADKKFLQFLLSSGIHCRRCWMFFRKKICC